MNISFIKSHIFEILTVISPYIVLITTLLVQRHNKLRQEVPIIKCSIEEHPAINVFGAILVIENRSQYNAFNFKINKELKPYTNNTVTTNTNILYSFDTLTYCLLYDEEKGTTYNLIISYIDKYKKKHEQIYEIYLKQNCSEELVLSDLQCDIIFKKGY